MVRRNLKVLTASLAIAISAAVAASAQTPPYTFMPTPPGSVAQTESIAFNGESAADSFRAVVSRKLLGSANKQKFYQWYLSIYQLRRGAYRLRYESPGSGGPLSRVEQANGAKMWFPVQTATIVGAATLMRPRVQQLVVQSHEMSADCGSGTVTVFATKPGGSVGPVATVTNGCDLSAKIAADGTSITLTGPYYAENAPMCCPTKSHATAVLRYSDGKWVESPSYFKVE
jgi:hypothetical protein